MRPFALLEGLLVIGLAITLITKPTTKVPVMAWPNDPKPVHVIQSTRALSDDACCRLTTELTEVSDSTEASVH